MRSQTIDVSKPVDRAIMGAYHLFLALLLLAPALYNGLALLNADSSFHLRHGADQDPWFDSPLLYSRFILPLHFDQTLWLILIVQSAITLFVLSVLVKHTVDPQRGAWYVYALVASVVLTGLGLLVSQIGPELFTPLMVIGIYLLMHFNGVMGRLERLGLLLVIAMACCFHQANFLIGLIVVFLGFCYHAVVARRLPARAGAVLVILAILAGLGAMILPNWLLHQQAVITRASSVQLLARLVGNGIALDYLRKACPAAGYSACAVVEDLQSVKAQNPNAEVARRAVSDAFLSPPALEKMGGWTAVSADAAKINLEAVRSQPGRFFETVGQDFLQQLGRFNSTTGLVVFDKTSPLYTLIGDVFPSSMFDAFRQSRQQSGDLHPAAIATANEVAAGLSLLLCVVLLLCVRYKPEILSAVFTLLTAVIVNAAVTSAFLTVSDHAQARIMPLVVIAAVILVFAALQGQSAEAEPEQSPA